MKVNKPPKYRLYYEYFGSIILNYKGLNFDIANTICKRNCLVKINFYGDRPLASNDCYINIYFNDYFNSQIELCLINDCLVTVNQDLQFGLSSIEKIYFDNEYLIISGNYIVNNPYNLATHFNDIFELIITIKNNQFEKRFIEGFQFYIKKLELINE